MTIHSTCKRCEYLSKCSDGHFEEGEILYSKYMCIAYRLYEQARKIDKSLNKLERDVQEKQ
jgi:hypothetical protein